MKTKLYHDNFQNYKRYGIPKAQLVIADIPYNVLYPIGCRRLPSKVGDIVYQNDGVNIYELTILNISLHKNKPYYETESIDFDDDAIGKSIFLTQEETKRKLKK